MKETPLYPSIGTNSAPYFIASSSEPEITHTDQGYLSVQVYSAQAAFSGPWWIGARTLSIVSQVNLHLDASNDLSNQDVRSIIQTREIEKDNAVQLGFSPMLVDFIPAKMKKLSVSIEYLVNARNYLRDLAGLIADKSLLSTISFAPGSAMVAKTLSGLSEKILASFLPAEERKPILQFSGDFNLALDGIKSGYYVILGSHSSKNPIPTDGLKLEIGDGGILKNNGEVVTQLSYVILKVGCVKAIRDRISGQSEWRRKLREVKQLVQDYSEDPFVEKEKNPRKEFWEKSCLPKLRDISALLKADPNFLDEEIDLIYRQAYRECLEIINKESPTVRSGLKPMVTTTWQIDTQNDLQFLGIPVDEDMEPKLTMYADRLGKAKRVFREFGPNNEIS
ncbi:hypothetical protein SAMN04488109_0301 [Chryseolinea serpens]|uniref:Uncharacterized protein n=1 Tax=Chryseolinea serpens TaxID=947013 RepID=A0A1M5JVT6_9BACT|nr:hypothetical protein [Chryseolinea serpens]SHG44400.1 hypothetical protein SAMN04488109_0301 [Chryseolinea serpens]